MQASVAPSTCTFLNKSKSFMVTAEIVASSLWSLVNSTGAGPALGREMDRQMFNGQELSKDQNYFKEIGEMI